MEKLTGDTMSLSRRKLIKSAGIAVAAAPFVNLGSVAYAGTSHISTKVMDLVNESLVVDMLAPLTLSSRTRLVQWLKDGIDETTLADFHRSGVTAVHDAMGFGGSEAHEMVLQYLGGINGLVAKHSDHFVRVDKAEDIARAKQAKKVGVILGVQNSDHFRSTEDVETFYMLGQRCSQLTYNSQNFLAGGSTDRVDGGVSDYGASIIEKMNEVGMLVDVSHCGPKTTLDAMDISNKPVAITHSNCRALNDHPRLKYDEAIVKMAKVGGVMGVTGVRNFVRNQEPTNIGHVVDHMDHIARLVGVEHVGIGSDTDLYGADDMPANELKQLRSYYKSSYAFRDKLDTDGFDSPLKFYQLAEALLKRGFSKKNIQGIMGQNFVRLLNVVWS